MSTEARSNEAVKGIGQRLSVTTVFAYLFGSRQAIVCIAASPSATWIGLFPALSLISVSINHCGSSSSLAPSSTAPKATSFVLVSPFLGVLMSLYLVACMVRGGRCAVRGEYVKMPSALRAHKHTHEHTSTRAHGSLGRRE